MSREGDLKISPSRLRDEEGRRAEDVAFSILVLQHHHVGHTPRRLRVQPKGGDEVIEERRLGRRLTVIDPKKYTMSEAVALMTGALEAPAEERVH